MNFGEFDMDDDEEFGEDGIEIPKPPLSQLMSSPMKEAIFLNYLSGTLHWYLGAVGWTEPAEHAVVVSALEETYPTFIHQTDRLYALLEEELISECIGESSKVYEMDDDTGTLEMAQAAKRHRLSQQGMLLELRRRRLQLYSLLSPSLEELNGG